MNIFKLSSKISRLTFLPKCHFSKTDTERVNLAWDKIERWYSQNAPKTSEWTLSSGASLSSIQDLENHLNIPLPEAFKASLERRNGINSLDAEHIKIDMYVNLSFELNCGKFTPNPEQNFPHVSLFLEDFSRNESFGRVNQYRDAPQLGLQKNFLDIVL